MRPISGLGLLFLLMFPLVCRAGTPDPVADDVAADQYYSQGQWALAARYLKNVTHGDPKDWQAYQRLGNCDYQLGKIEEAMEAYQTSLALHPDNPNLIEFVKSQAAFTRSAGPDVSGGPVSSDPVTAPTASVDSSLPEPGTLLFRLTGGSGLLDNSDIKATYGNNLTSAQAPLADFGTQAALLYAIIPNLQLGLGVNLMVKPEVMVQSTAHDPNNPSYAYMESDQWRENAIGPAFLLRGIFPLDAKNDLAGELEFGIFSFMDSSLTYTASDNYGGHYAGNLPMTGGGKESKISFIYETVLARGTAMELGLGYRYMNYDSAGDINGIIIEGNDSQNSFSGFELTAAVLFY